MRIIIDIPIDQEQQFIHDFIVGSPIPVNEDGAPLMPVEDWIKKKAVDYLNSLRDRGARRVYDQLFIPPPPVVRVDIEPAVPQVDEPLP